MGKHVLSNNIAASVRQPYTKVTHEWYNAMIDEAINALGKGLFGTGTGFVVLYGCVNSASPNADISAGAIYYNGEIYLCPAFVDATITNAIVGTITTAYATGDPVLFSDGASYDVHQVKTIVWSDAASGSGDIDYDDLNFQTGTVKKIINIGDWDMDSTQSVNVAHGVVDYKKIVSAKAVIRDDADSIYRPLDSFDSVSTNLIGGVSQFGVSNIVLARLAGGDFDNTAYNSTSFNRGYIVIEYTI